MFPALFGPFSIDAGGGRLEHHGRAVLIEPPFSAERGRQRGRPRAEAARLAQSQFANAKVMVTVTE